MLSLLWLVAVKAQLIATPPFACSTNTTTITFDVTLNPTDLPLVSGSLTSFTNTSDSIPLSLNLSTNNQIIGFAPPGRSGAQLLRLNLSDVGGAVLTTTITYYDPPTMNISSGPATYRSTGGNDLNLAPLNCQQLCTPGSTLYVKIVAPNLTQTVSMVTKLLVVNSSYVYNGLIPYEIQELENATSPLQVFVSYDHVLYFDSSVRLTLRKTAPLRVGFGLYANVMDFGWSYSCNQARVAVTELYGRSMEPVSLSNLPGSTDFVALFNKEGPFDIWFYCSGVAYLAHKQLAQQFPNTTVIVGSGDGDIYGATGAIAPVLTDNFNTCWGDVEEARYLAGIAAGGFALQQGLRDIGFVAALRVPEVMSGINAFANGVRKVHPNATIHLKFVRSFFDRFTERACAEQFLADGIRIIAQYTDSKEPQLAAQRGGGWAIGSNSNVERSLFGDFILTTPYIVWQNTLLPSIRNVFNDVKGGIATTCGLKDKCVGLAQLSPLVPDSIKQLVEAEEASGNAYTERLFCGEIKDNHGNVRVPNGTCLPRSSQASFDWLLENVDDQGDYIAPLPYEEKRLIRNPLFGLVCGIMALMLVIVFGLVALVVSQRKTPVMKASSWKFLVVILVAVMLSLCAVPLLGMDEGRTSPENLNHVCQAFPWLIMLSMLFSFGSLFGKTWRLFYLFVSKGRSFPRSHFTDGNLFGFVFGAATPGIVICALWTGLDPLHWVRVAEVTDEFGNTLVSHGRCTSGIAAPAILAAYFVLLLLVGNYLAYQTRKLPTSFTESQWIAQILSSVFQCLLLYIPLDLLISDASTEALFLLRALSLTLVNFMMVAFMFGPKLLLMKKYSLKELEEMQSKSMNSYLQESSGLTVNSPVVSVVSMTSQDPPTTAV